MYFKYILISFNFRYALHYNWNTFSYYFPTFFYHFSLSFFIYGFILITLLDYF